MEREDKMIINIIQLALIAGISMLYGTLVLKNLNRDSNKKKS